MVLDFGGGGRTSTRMVTLVAEVCQMKDGAEVVDEQDLIFLPLCEDGGTLTGSRDSAYIVSAEAAADRYGVATATTDYL